MVGPRRLAAGLEGLDKVLHELRLVRGRGRRQFLSDLERRGTQDGIVPKAKQLATAWEGATGNAAEVSRRARR